MALTRFRAAAVAGGLLAAAAAASPAETFTDRFTGATLRLELFHTGTAGREELSLRRARVEGPWPGSRTQLLDRSNLGKYFFEVADLATQELIFSRGFASLYGEWETTGEAAAGAVETFMESLRFPEPRAPVQVRVRKRAAEGSYREIWSVAVDPGSPRVDRAPVAPWPMRTLLGGGEPATRVDLLILGDGYTGAEMERFRADAERLTGELFALEPFSSRRSDFSVRILETPAREPGISRPRSGLFRDSPLGARYDTFGSERYVMTLDDHAWRRIAAAAPYDFVIILVNSEKYGGGGIFGLYATAAAGSAFGAYLMVHEFGHHFAGLGDEYYTSEVAYEEFHPPRVEPWEPNITALLDPGSLKWRDLVAAETPLPTPWRKEAFEEASRGFQGRRRELRSREAPESELEALFAEERRQMSALLGGEEHAGKVGAFEGASYRPTGLYRPQADCIMFTRDEVGFCAVCRRAIERVIDQYVR